MISPYKDEIAYSWFSRYHHKYSGNANDLRPTENLFGKRGISIDMYCPQYLNYFINQLPEKMGIGADDIINKHTVFPLFRPFMDSKRVDKIIISMKGGNTNHLMYDMGLYKERFT